MNSLKATLYRVLTDGTESETPVTVEYAYSPAGGDDWNEPRYGESVEVQSVTGTDGRQVETTPEDDERLAAECLEDAGERGRVGAYRD